MPTICVVQAVAALVLLGLAATASARTLLQASLTDADILNFAYVRLTLLSKALGFLVAAHRGSCVCCCWRADGHRTCRLNLEYLEAEFYSCAAYGKPLASSLRGGGPASIGCQKATLDTNTQVSN